MGQSADQIRQEIEQSRNDAGKKIDQLQSQVLGTADDLRTNVQDTTEQVIGQVKDTVEQTVESVKESIDIRQYIEQQPILSLGVALVGGFVLGGIMGGSKSDHNHGHQTFSYSGGGYPTSSAGASHAGPQSAPSANQGSSVSSSVRAAIQKTGLEDTISSAASALIGSLTDQLKSTLDQNFPGFADKMSTAQESSKDFAGKARDAQSPTT
jgi:ElaB/YqjD/DUF883 family membrane-anchored ribosome-binding protein